jgi:ribosomal protein S18 acetylase RimI-like enzyme
MAQDMNVLVEKASKSHIPEIVELWKEFIDFHKDIDPFYTRSKDGHAKFGEYIEKLLSEDDSLVLVAVHAARAVGFGIARILKYPPVFEADQYGDLIDLAVTADHRRSGIGNMMLDSILEWYRSRGISRIELRVVPHNRIGYSFWRKHGFKECTHTLFRHLGSNLQTSKLNSEGLTPKDQNSKSGG